MGNKYVVRNRQDMESGTTAGFIGLVVNIYVALLRSINVGGKHVVPMDELAGYFEEAGCQNVRTYLQSGNVVFHCRNKFDGRHTSRIAKRVLSTRGFEPKMLILSPEELRCAAANNPFPTTSGKALHFFFLESASERPDLARLESAKASTEKFELAGKVFYLYAPEGVGRSKLPAAVERSLGVSATARNWNTVAKLLAMAG